MKVYIATHKYCGAVRIILGYDEYDAMRKAGLNRYFWTVKESKI